MSCCYFKKHKICDSSYLEKNKNIEKPKQTEFLSEVLTCGTCKKAFSLRENELSAICGGCNQFLHCGIAGKCVGPNCGNSFHRLSWCIKCVPKTVLINLHDLGSGKDCLCQECLYDPLTPSSYKRKI
jgi:hypothetical protein